MDSEINYSPGGGYDNLDRQKILQETVCFLLIYKKNVTIQVEK
jgi:hypothetical protein